MKQFSRQLHKKATTTVKLQAAEKRELREQLVAYMEYHPLPADMKTKSTRKSATEQIATEAFKTVTVPFRALFKYGAVAAVLLLVAVPFVAERTVPGDALYAVKVQFNEELRSTLTFDSYQKVEWETERLNRRIAEARLLASEGRLTEEAEAEVAAAVREHTENAKREIEVLRTEDADAATIASIALDTTLEVQSTALRSDDVVDGEVSPETNLIATAIDESRDQAGEEATSTAPAYEKLMARVEQNTTRIYELRDSLSEVVPAEELAEVNRRITDLETSIQSAIDLAGTDDEEARQILVDVLQRSQRLIVFMSEIEVNQTVDIETLVPVILTPEEKSEKITSGTTAVEAKLTQIDALLEGAEDDTVMEKAVVGKTMVEGLLEKMASSTADLADFTGYLTEALAVADDTLTLLEKEHLPVDLPDEEASSSVAEVATSSASSTTADSGATTTVVSLPVEQSTSTDRETTSSSSSEENIIPDTTNTDDTATSTDETRAVDSES